MMLMVFLFSKSFTYGRLEFLRDKFKMHMMFNETAEALEQKISPHRDFYNVRKVSTSDITQVIGSNSSQSSFSLFFLSSC